MYRQEAVRGEPYLEKGTLSGEKSRKPDLDAGNSTKANRRKVDKMQARLGEPPSFAASVAPWARISLARVPLSFPGQDCCHPYTPTELRFSTC